MSTIDDTSIDQTFPVAGQDNNSQGFRDNFSTIKNNFTVTKTHIAEVTTNPNIKLDLAKYLSKESSI